MKLADLVIKKMEPLLSRRGEMTRGKTKWELEILFAAYEEAGTPHEGRKFGLTKPPTEPQR